MTSRSTAPPKPIFRWPESAPKRHGRREYPKEKGQKITHAGACKRVRREFSRQTTARFGLASASFRSTYPLASCSFESTQASSIGGRLFSTKKLERGDDEWYYGQELRDQREEERREKEKQRPTYITEEVDAQNIRPGEYVPTIDVYWMADETPTPRERALTFKELCKSFTVAEVCRLSLEGSMGKAPKGRDRACIFSK